MPVYYGMRSNNTWIDIERDSGARFRCHICETQWLQDGSLYSHLKSKFHRSKEQEDRWTGQATAPVHNDEREFQFVLPVPREPSPVLPMEEEWWPSPEPDIQVLDSVNLDDIQENHDSGLDYQENHDPNQLSDEPIRHGEWFPYDSHAMAILDIYDNMPRRPMSDEVLRMYIHMLKSFNIPDVPSLNTFRKRQKELREKYSLIPKEVRRNQSDSYFVNDLRHIISRDWSSRQTRSHLNIYPDAEPRIIQEVWDGSKIQKYLPSHLVPPMWLHQRRGNLFYVGEIAQDDRGKFWLLSKWLRGRDDMGSVSDVVLSTPLREYARNCFEVDSANTTIIQCDSLAFNQPQLEQHDALPQNISGLALHQGRLHPDRTANNEPIYISYVEVFGDDVSGNQSKAWNQHWNVYLSHRNLPRKIALREFHVHFVSTSQTVPIHEQISEVKNAIEDTHHNPLRVYDAVLGQVIRVRLALLNFAADNPMASEITHHVGGRGNFPCRKCLVGGNQSYKESVGYNSLFHAGDPRSLFQTRVAVMKEAVAVACKFSSNAMQKLAREAGVKSRFPTATTASLHVKGDSSSFMELKDKQGALAEYVRENNAEILPSSLTITGFNPITDTPIEILHTVLLGYVKYIWLETYDNLSASNRLDVFATRMESTEMNGLNLPPLQPSYITRYGKSLTGRYFRQLIQVGAFHLKGLLEEDLFQLWKDAAKLTGMIWFTKIVEPDDYCSMLNAQVAHVLDGFSRRQPRKIIAKAKLHMLVHLADDVKRFGPLVGVSTERFESFNAVFRASSVHSNRHNPSKDIAWDQIGGEWVKYLMSDGLLSTTNSISQPGYSLQKFLSSKLVQNAFSFDTAIYEQPVAGSHSVDRSQITYVYRTGAVDAINKDDFANVLELRLPRCGHIISRNLDRCARGSFVFFEETSMHRVGRINELLLSADIVLAVVSIFHIHQQVDETFQLPLIADTGLTLLVLAEKILFNFNIQPSSTASIYLVNTYSFHNIELLYQSLPKQLIQPRVIDEAARQDFHRQLAQRITTSTHTSSRKRPRSPSATPIPTSSCF